MSFLLCVIAGKPASFSTCESGNGCCRLVSLFQFLFIRMFERLPPVPQHLTIRRPVARDITSRLNNTVTASISGAADAPAATFPPKPQAPRETPSPAAALRYRSLSRSPHPEVGRLSAALLPSVAHSLRIRSLFLNRFHLRSGSIVISIYGRGGLSIDCRSRAFSFSGVAEVTEGTS